jgi:hypothetical protein
MIAQALVALLLGGRPALVGAAVDREGPDGRNYVIRKAARGERFTTVSRGGG